MWRENSLKEEICGNTASRLFHLSSICTMDTINNDEASSKVHCGPRIKRLRAAKRCPRRASQPSTEIRSLFYQPPPLLRTHRWETPMSQSAAHHKSWNASLHHHCIPGDEINAAMGPFTSSKLMKNCIRILARVSSVTFGKIPCHAA